MQRQTTSPVEQRRQEKVEHRAVAPVETPKPEMKPPLVNPKDGLTYVWIPRGSFLMGCSRGDTNCQDDERPAHRVTISRGYYIG